MKKTYVYVDGLNLYYLALRTNPDLKWLNIYELCKNILDNDNDIIKVKYFTANVLGRADRAAPIRQHQYLRALASIPEIEIHRGKMLLSEQPLYVNYSSKKYKTFKPKPWLPVFPKPKTVNVSRIEEKGSDVALGSHLVHDAHSGKFDVAAVITNDTDLYEAIRIVNQELNIPIGLLTPISRPAESLRKVVSFVKHIDRNRLLKAQLPERITLQNRKVIIRNKEWK